MNKAETATVHQRLAEAKACLDYLDLERSRLGDPNFGKAIEDKAIWRELLELELQDADERIQRICDAAERALTLER